MTGHEKVTDGVWRIRGRRSNIYLIEDEPLVLIDTGMPGDSDIILNVMKEHGHVPEEVKYICITHAHLDHVGSLAELKAVTGANIIAAFNEQDYLEGRKMLCSMKREGLLGNLFKTVLFVVEKHAQKYTPVQLDIPLYEGVMPGLPEGMQAIATPGHSPGSLSWYHAKKRIMFTGDALTTVPQLRLPFRAGCCDYSQALVSLEKIAGYDFDICLCGHGEPLVAGADMKVRGLLQVTSYK